MRSYYILIDLAMAIFIDSLIQAFYVNDDFIDSCGRSKISHELLLLVGNRLKMILLIIRLSMLLIFCRNIYSCISHC